MAKMPALGVAVSWDHNSLIIRIRVTNFQVNQRLFQFAFLEITPTNVQPALNHLLLIAERVGVRELYK